MRFLHVAPALALLATTGRATADPSPPPPLAPLPGAALVSPEIPPPSPASAHWSPGMMYTGILITCIGIASVPIGVGVSQIPDPGDFPTHGMAGLFIIVLGGTLVPAIGIPLWVVGARTPKATAAVPSWAVPAVTASPRGATVRWTF